jgi:predicted dehydrogenase
MSRRGLGIIGLGRRWRRCRPSLTRLHERFEIRAVCDPVARRAEAEARRLGCAAAAGPADLLGRDEVEAVLLLGRPWYGLWPLEYACAVGKPVFCAVPLAQDLHADVVAERVRACGLPVMMAQPCAASPALDRLRGLLTERLGPPRLVRIEQALPPSRRPGADLLQASPTAALLAICGRLLGASPDSVSLRSMGDAGLVTLVLQAEGGRAAQVSLWTGVEASCRVEVVAEKGTAVAHLPRRVRWSDAEGEHMQRLPPQSSLDALLGRFADALDAGQPPRPGIEDACETLAWSRAAVRACL